MALPDVTLGDFTGGLNTNDYEEEIAGNELQSCLNFLADRQGRLRHRGGQHNVLPALSGPVQGFTRYANASVRYLTYALAGNMWAYDESFGTTFQVAAGLNAANKVEMANVFDRLFWVDGVSNVKEWYGDGALTAINVGMAAPPSTTVPTAGAAGNPDGTYQYYVSYYNAHGIESNLSLASAQVTAASQLINLASVPVSGDSQVIGRYIYKDGGTLGVPRRVGSIANNSTTTFVDNVADQDVSLIQGAFNKDPAPAGARYLFWHQNRLFLAGFDNTPYTVYYSTYGRPEYFSQTERFNLDTDGGTFDVTPNFDNPITGMCSNGSMLVIGRKKSFHILFSDRDARNMQLRDIATIGIVSHRSMANCKGILVFLASDGQVYMLSDTTPVMISQKIERTLQGIDGVYLQNACAAYVGERYILVIPRGSGLTPVAYAYDFRHNHWVDLSDNFMDGTMLYADQTASAGGELLLGTSQGYVGPAGPYSGVISVLTRTDATPLTVNFKTGQADLGQGSRIKRIKSVRVRGNLAASDPDNPPVVTIEARLTANNNVYSIVSHSYKLTGASGVLIDTTVHSDLVGQIFTLAVSGVATGGEINTITLEYALVG